MQKTEKGKNQTFKEIIRFIIKNEHKGMERFYAEYAKFITIIARSVCKTQDKVDSVVNKVLYKVWKNAKTLQNVENPEGWIYVVTLNCSKDELKERWNLELKEQICSTKDPFEEIHDQDSFENTISVLKKDEQDIMRCKFSRELSFQDIANIVERPLSTVTSSYYRALEKLKKIYEK